MTLMVGKQSEISRDAQFAILIRRKWQADIERAMDKIKLQCCSKPETFNDKLVVAKKVV